MKTIDLGSKPEGGEVAMPSEPPQEKQPKVYYPSFYLHNCKAGAADFPEAGAEGLATIRFKIASKTETNRDSGDGAKKDCSVELEVMTISFEDSKPGNTEGSAADDIEKGLQEAETPAEDSAETEEE